jgi:hypothetical protein
MDLQKRGAILSPPVIFLGDTIDPPIGCPYVDMLLYVAEHQVTS